MGRASIVAPKTYLERLRIFVLLLVDYSKTKINLIRLLKSRIHSHDLAKSLLRVLQATISIIENADAVP